MWRSILSLLASCVLAVDSQCVVVISLLQNVDYGGQIPRGLEDAPAVIVTGAREGPTLGGPATPESKCVYYYEPDSDALGDDPNYDGLAQFTGPDWPYVETDASCTIEYDDSIAEDSIFRTEGYVTVSPYEGVLFGGLPLYFYPDDAPGVGPNFDGLDCRCNFGPWTSVEGSGQGTTITVRQNTDAVQPEGDTTTPPPSTDNTTPQGEYDNTLNLGNGDLVLEYTLTSETLKGRATVPQKVGWMGVGFGPGGMVGSNAVVGQVSVNGVVQEYALGSKRSAGVQPTAANSVTDASFTPGETSSVMTFTIPVSFGDVGLLAGVENNLIWAYGEAESIAYHDQRDEETVVLNLSGAAQTGDAPASSPAEDAVPQTAYENTVTLANSDVVFDYTLTADALMGRATVPKMVGWLGIGFGPGGMVGSNAIIGQVSANGLVQEYALTSRRDAGVQPTATNSVTDGVFTPGDASSTLTFTVPLTFGDVGILPGVANNLIWAYGESESISYHDQRDVDTIVLIQSDASADPQAGDTDTAPADDATAYEHTVDLAGGDVVFEYTLTADTLTGRASVPKNVGWLGLGFGPGGMVGSNAVIGQVSANGLVQEYALSSKSSSGVQPTAANSVTNGVFTPGDISTLTFTIPLTFGDVGILPGVENNLVWAYGESESISYHDQRDSDTLVLKSSTADENATTAPPTTEDNTTPSEDTTTQAGGSALTNRIILDKGGPVFDYTINDTHLVGIATMAREVGWMAIGFGPGSMVGSTAVVGQTAPNARRRQSDTGPTVEQYDLTSQSASGVVTGAENGVSDGSLSTSADASVLSFTIPVQFGSTNLVADTPDANNLIWAFGTDGAISYHTDREVQAVTLSTAASAPLGSVPTTEEQDTMTDPSAGSSTVGTDCTPPEGSEYDSQITLEAAAGGGAPVTFAWTMDTDTNTLNVQAVSATSVGWLGVGFGNEPSRMIPSNAVIGQMSDSSVVSYTLESRSPSGVQPTASNEVVEPASIVDSAGGENTAAGTIMTFSVPMSFVPGLSEGADTYIIWARGSGDVSQHSPNNQGSYTLNLATCAGQATSTSFDMALLYSHGIMMALAWMLFVPLAISASALRPVFTQLLGKNRAVWWFHSHRLFNSLAILLATAAFIIAFWLSTEDFVNTHQKLGLAVMIIMWLQPLNAFIRPHPAAPGEKRPILRVLWEILHKLLGYAAVVAAVVNVCFGLDEAFADDWLYIAYGVYVGIFAAIFLALYAYYLFIYKPPSKAGGADAPPDSNHLERNTAPEQSNGEGVSGNKLEATNDEMLAPGDNPAVRNSTDSTIDAMNTGPSIGEMAKKD